MGVPAGLDEARAARLESLRARYPRWWIWHDDAGWHAMRRGSFMERNAVAAVHSLHLPNAALLAVHLAAEDALEIPAAEWQL